MAKGQASRDLFEHVKSGIQDIGFQPEEGRLRNPFSGLAPNLCRVAMHRSSVKKPKRETLTIALVSMPNLAFDVETFSSLQVDALPAGIDEDDCKRQLVAFRRSASRRMTSAFREALGVSLEEHGADIVCVSELGLPSLDALPLMPARDFANRKSKQHQALIVAGSAHDSQTLYNTAYFYYPDGPATGRAFHKHISAVSTGELVAAPSRRRVHAVNIFGFGIAMMICLDVADYATLASIVKVGDAIDMILIPCFTNKFEKMVEIAQVASKALPGMVALVNANLPDTVARPSHVARFGQLTRAIETSTESGAIISIVQLNCAQFKEERTQLKQAPENQMEWLFGSRDRPEVYS